MVKNLYARHKEECDADREYYECSDFGFEYKGCCSHDPCNWPRGCRDIFGSRPTRSLSTLGSETTAESTDSEMTASESSLLTRRRTSSTVSMDEDNEETTYRHKHSKTMTDSGTTITVPNPNRVTVTKNTLIFTSKLPSSITPVESITGTRTGTNVFTLPTAPLESTPGVNPTETGTSNTSPENNSGGPSIGLIVGGVVGGIAALGLVVLAVILLRRRKHNEEQFVDSADGPYNFDEKEEKSYLGRVLSRNANQKNPDPFAPFGGRIDRVDDPLRPPSGTFEMDATENVVHELPTATFGDAKAKESQPGDHVAGSQAANPALTGHSGAPAYPVDPRSNLNATMEDRQQKQFVNHWNQYRALGESARQV
ncbi:fatty-acid amide hydrolase [Fusarium austroafricanum]|uniref:Fatty-acid amide hydrolase n=1 Tax=Fusarium austroafricanum TaxID=2364996 RepID=A0A8H4NXY4_9HYPO|nr:fatty-acid amide hydrolase [Fusarium austroafricanum]